MDAILISKTGEAKGKTELPASVFGREISKRVLHEVLIAYQANQRRGTSNTKTRGEVSGGGRKPWKQKGTGNARSGSNRSPLWRKGGIIFGPHPRSYRIDVNEDKRRFALATALIAKAQDQALAVLEALPEVDGKTSALSQFFDKAVPKNRILVIVDKKSDLLKRAVRNLARVCLIDVNELNPMDLMRANHILFTKSALEALVARFPQG
jgi:large subunit ribosomal protein L4